MYIRHHTVSPASPKVTMTQDVLARIAQGQGAVAIVAPGAQLAGRMGHLEPFAKMAQQEGTCDQT
jgi:hypothetical protein